MSWFDRYPEAQFVAGGTLEATHGGKLVFSAQAYWPREGFFKPPDGLDLLLGGLHPSWTTTVYRTGVFDLVGPPDQSLPNRLDLDFTLRIACRYPFVVFRKPSGIFVRHRSQYGESIAAKIVSQYEAMIEYYESIDGLDPVTKEILRKGLERHMVKCVQQVAVKELLRGEAAQALQTLDSYHDRGYRREPLSSFISSVAVAGKLCPPALGVLRPLETLRRAVQARSSRAAARRNGLQAGKIDEALAFLKS